MFFLSPILNHSTARGTIKPFLIDVYHISTKLRPQTNHLAGGWVNRSGRLVRIAFTFHIDQLLLSFLPNPHSVVGEGSLLAQYQSIH
jgi:hypothetical protein